jgi:hypothetical protein
LRGRHCVPLSRKEFATLAELLRADGAHRPARRAGRSQAGP